MYAIEIYLMWKRFYFGRKNVTSDRVIEENDIITIDLSPQVGNIWGDYPRTLGHSIVKAKDDRIYIKKGNTMKLSDVNYFTFEPHIAFPDSKYGYKKENIYYFEENKLVELAKS